MSTPLPAHREMALSAYAYDLGVPLPEFLVRLHLCPAEEALAHIAAGAVRMDGEVLADPALVLTRRLLRNGTVVELGGQRVTLAFWSDDNGLR